MASFEDLQNNASSQRRKISQSPTQSVASGIFQINTAVSGLRRMVDILGTSRDTPEHRTKLHSVRQRIGQLVKETSGKLKALSESDQGKHVNPNKKIEDAKLARDFQSTLQDVQKVQQLAAERESSYLPFYESSLPTSSNVDVELGFDPEQEKRALLGVKMRQEVVHLGSEISYNEAIMEEREQGIKDIQEEILQANEIFRDLAVFVHGQGIVIEEIESNLVSSNVTTAQATKELSKAEKSGKSTSKWCWWVVLIVVVVVIIILIVILT